MDDLPPRSDSLLTMLTRQRELQVSAYGKDPCLLEGEERVGYIKDMAYALIKEITEAVDEVGWKSWATSRHVNEEAFRKEMVDAWHFFMNLLLAGAGVSVTATGTELQMFVYQLTNDYLVKNRRNAERQREGYTGLIGGAEHDALHVEG